jgi:CheY-like chemotaxis protein
MIDKNDEKPRNTGKITFKGDILLCEDDDMNQMMICHHLERAGLKPVVAGNGKEGVDLVAKRLRKNEKPFDLILMDIYMPELNGMEAAKAITVLGNTTPIIAITANATDDELALYEKCGMQDYLGKPVSEQELWNCLMKYLPENGNNDADKQQQSLEDEVLQNRLKAEFARNNRRKVQEIRDALSADDIKLAHRLAHTLKSSAGLIGKTELRDTAAEIEELLLDDTIPDIDLQLCKLDGELHLVIEELRHLIEVSVMHDVIQIPDQKETRALFNKLQHMIENINPECVNLLDSIRVIPGTEELAVHIADYDFESAAKSLEEVRKKTGV